MGGAAAARLAARGMSVTAWSRTPASVRRWRHDHPDAHVTLAETPADAARSADHLLAFLSDGSALEHVVLGADGVLSGAEGHDVLLADLGTSGPGSVGRVHAALRSSGVRFVDAPVSGSIAAVRDGSLLVMAGGAAEDVESLRSVLLGVLAREVVHVGMGGAGAAMKLCVNAVLFALNAGLAEALRVAESSGVDRDAAYDVLARSAVAAPYLAYKREAFLERGSPVAFSLDLAAKDLRLAVDLAAAAGVGTPVWEAVARGIDAAREAGLGADDLARLSWEV